MVSWNDILAWHPGSLDGAVGQLDQRSTTMREAADQLDQANHSLQSRGQTASAAKRAVAESSEASNRVVSLLSELGMATAQAASGVADVETRVHENLSFAAMKELTIFGDGATAISDPRWQRIRHRLIYDAFGGAAMLWEALRERDDLRRDVADAVRRANEVDEAYTGRLEAVSRGEIAPEAASAFAQGLPDLPQKGWTDREVAAWWNSLSVDEQNRIIREHPDAIGNLDGIDGRSRDLANQHRLTKLLAETDNAIAKAEAAFRNASTDTQMLLAQRNLDALRERRDELTTIRDTRNNSGGQLLLLDAQGSEGVRAALATGDVDSAKHVATMVRGMGTTAHGLPGLVADSTRLRDITAVEQGLDTSDIAVVTWLGYDAPQGMLDVAFTGRAHDGAGHLNAFVEGIHASRAYGTHGDPHMTVLGHSYGSTTSGMAMRDVNVGVVDDLVMFGSPGSGVQDVREYNIADTAYVSAVDGNDIVLGIGPDWAFGKNPTEVPGIEHLSNDDGVGKQGWTDLSSRHSTYLQVPEGRTSTGILSDFAAVIAGTK